MIIKKLEIGGFGKFNDTAFDFDKGANLIYGNNEDGKTTLMAFVKMMLYSSSAKTEKSADLFKALRKKYRPWNGAPMSGAMEFESGGMLYRLQKEFLKSDATDKTTVFCLTTGENVQIENKNEAGEHFLGMSLDEFERSIFMGQGGGFAADSAADSLAMRISNLSVSGDENISHGQITKRLCDAAEELVSKSRKKGLLVEAEQRLEALNDEKHQLALLEDEQKDAEAEILKLNTEIRDLEGELDALSAADKLENAKRDLNAYYTLQNKLNLLKAVSGQLAAYDADRAEMEKYIIAAKALNDEIEGKLSLIQEATLRKDTSVSDEDYARLTALDKKCSDIRQDLEAVRSRIFALWEDRKKKLDSAANKSKCIAWSALAVCLSLAAAAFFFPPYGMIAALVLIFFGMGLFSFFFFSAKKRSTATLDAKLSNRDYEGAVRNLNCFVEDYAEKSPDALENILGALLAESSSALESGLEALGISTMEQLRAKSGEFHTESIKAITDDLARLKEDFVALSNAVKPCAAYPTAKILYVELCESLAKNKSVRKEIDAICHATGIENTDEDFVADKIKALGALVKNAPIQPAESSASAAEIRTALSEKRELLSRLQSSIKRPKRGMSELLKEIKSTRESADALKQRYDEISIALDVMNEAITDTNKGLGSQLSLKVSKYIAEISDGRYRDILVPRDLSLEARTDGSQGFHEWKYLSTGAIDKLYLCLRLAMTDILAEGHGAIPLLLDDIFSQYDDQSTRTALEFLNKYIKSTGSVSQLMFFTCHKNIYDMAKEIFDGSRNITL